MCEEVPNGSEGSVFWRKPLNRYIAISVLLILLATHITVDLWTILPFPLKISVLRLLD